jgi:elongator complex protein 3
MNLIKRDHYKEDVIRATRLLKNAGFKVAYHLMPNLPGSTPEMDIAMGKEIFADEGLRPDQIKIYPCVVLEKAALNQWFQQGKYKTYDTETLIEVVAQMKRAVPLYTRIERVYRDVPSHDIIDGSRHINFRELVQKRMKEMGWECRCIRCKEVGGKLKTKNSNLKTTTQNLKLFMDEYSASDGQEFFISYESEDRKVLYAFTRLRLPRKNARQQLSSIKNAALIRELHTYGQLVPITDTKTRATQHKGLGKKLLSYAENVANNKGYDTVAVISGVGVCGYYEKLGYVFDEKWGYMVKFL